MDKPALPATGYTTGNLNFISVGLDPFTQGNKLSYSNILPMLQQ
jgi:hypothetical protein